MLATEPCGAPHWEHTSRPPRDRSARQSREPHCKQTDVFDTRPVVKNGDPWLELQAVEAWLQTSCVFNNLTLQFNLGEHTAVLGPNGSGKSTLVRLIDRSIHPVVKPGSHLRLFGSPLPLQWELRRRIGLVSSDVEARVPLQASVHDLVLSAFYGSLGLRRDQVPSRERQQHVSRLLNHLCLDHLASSPFQRLSDGQKRRVLIARALAHEPDVLVLDEPTNALDLKAKHELQGYLRGLCQGSTTLVMITHQVDALIPEISRVVCLREGAVVDDGICEEVLTGPRLSALFDTPLQVVRAAGYRQVLPLS